MKRIYILFCLLLAVCAASAQHSGKAKELLDKASETYHQAGGVCIEFGGSQQGTLLLKGDKFYMETEDVETWFDGKTQWSYVKSNEEVNISTPTREELQSIHPYALISLYQNGFSYRYEGTTTYKGKQGQIVVLTPPDKQELRSITLAISSQYEPLYIQLKLKGGREQNFYVSSYRSHLNLDDQRFRFSPKKYPHAEIIDMR